MDSNLHRGRAVILDLNERADLSFLVNQVVQSYNSGTLIPRIFTYYSSSLFNLHL